MGTSNIHAMKGVSPLVAVVMLIAFALVVSGIFYSWVSQFTIQQREQFEFCSKARLTLMNAYYNSGTGNINLLIYNGGDVPLTGFSILVSPKPGGNPVTYKDYLKTEIEDNDMGILLITYAPDMDDIMVKSTECPNAQDSIKLFDVKGL